MTELDLLLLEVNKFEYESQKFKKMVHNMKTSFNSSHENKSKKKYLIILITILCLLFTSSNYCSKQCKENYIQQSYIKENFNYNYII